MTELSFQQKQRLGEARLTVDTEAFFDERVPAEVTDAITSFAAELSPLPPEHVPLRKDDRAAYGWPADGVREKIRADGGSIRFGWRLREWPLVLLTAEFHAVWVDPDGNPVDITPEVADGKASLFVPDPAYSDVQGGDPHPPTRYHVLHQRRDRSREIAERISRMKPAQRAYEDRRAQKTGRTLEEWLSDKLYPDPVPQSIALFIEACQSFDAKLPTLPDLIEAAPVEPEGLQPATPPDTSAQAPVTVEAGDAGGPGEDDAHVATALAELAAVAPDEDALDDDEEEPFDETEPAVDSIDRWSTLRERRRNGVRRSLLAK
jgi:catechol 2,3-dioxygenase-like lactoylglutathione lyase family enzyme